MSFFSYTNASLQENVTAPDNNTYSYALTYASPLGTLTLNRSLNVFAFLVGGGGGGGSSQGAAGGGGGGGSINFCYTTLPATTYTITVGDGGISDTPGGESSISNNVASANGGEPGNSIQGGNGGSIYGGLGGGGGYNGTNGTSGGNQIFGGGGGGGGTVNAFINAGNGGNNGGNTSNGGGGGGGSNSSNPGNGNDGGGSGGGVYGGAPNSPTSGAVNTGGGGGGAYFYNSSTSLGAAGGSGVVVFYFNAIPFYSSSGTSLSQIFLPLVSHSYPNPTNFLQLGVDFNSIYEAQTIPQGNFPSYTNATLSTAQTDINGTTFMYCLTYLTSGTFVSYNAIPNCSILLVGGGGGGNGGSSGGGGAVQNINNLEIFSNTSCTIYVGTGGNPLGIDGTASSIVPPPGYAVSSTTYVANGGSGYLSVGGGGNYNALGGSAGSFGNFNGGAGLSGGFSNASISVVAYGGGGGGLNSNSSVAPGGNGGSVGSYNSITPMYGGGGGGDGYNSPGQETSGGFGGYYGGGNGSTSFPVVPGTPGTPNTGGGGGYGYNGGDGIVKIYFNSNSTLTGYRISTGQDLSQIFAMQGKAAYTTTGNPTVSSSSTYNTILTYTSSAGSFTCYYANIDIVFTVVGPGGNGGNGITYGFQQNYGGGGGGGGDVSIQTVTIAPGSVAEMSIGLVSGQTTSVTLNSSLLFIANSGGDGIAGSGGGSGGAAGGPGGAPGGNGGVYYTSNIDPTAGGSTTNGFSGGGGGGVASSAQVGKDGGITGGGAGGGANNGPKPGFYYGGGGGGGSYSITAGALGYQGVVILSFNI